VLLAVALAAIVVSRQRLESCKIYYCLGAVLIVCVVPSTTLAN